MDFYKKTKEILDHYGSINQFLIAMQECGELVQAISKYMTIKTPYISEDKMEARQNIVSEMADVSIMLLQLQHALNITDNELTNEMKHKIQRQLQRIESENHEESKDSDEKESKTESDLFINNLIELSCNCAGIPKEFVTDTPPLFIPLTMMEKERKDCLTKLIEIYDVILKGWDDINEKESKADPGYFGLPHFDANPVSERLDDLMERTYKRTGIPKFKKDIVAEYHQGVWENADWASINRLIESYETIIKEWEDISGAQLVELYNVILKEWEAIDDAIQNKYNDDGDGFKSDSESD